MTIYLYTCSQQPIDATSAFYTFYEEWVDQIVVWTPATIPSRCDPVEWTMNEGWRRFRGWADWHITVGCDQYLTNPTSVRSLLEEIFSDTDLVFAQTEHGSRLVAFNNDTIDSVNYRDGWSQPTILDRDDKCCTDEVVIYRHPNLRLIHSLT